MFRLRRELRELTQGYLKNLGNPPPWPQKLAVIVRNRRRALGRGCCGNYGEPGC
jgi:hypothetical protein